MHIGVVSLMAVALAAVASSAVHAGSLRQSPEKKVAPPIACRPAAIGAEDRARWREVSARVKAAMRETRELPNGYAVSLPNDREMSVAVAEFVSFESKCCPFLDFTVRYERDGGPLWLELTGGEGVKDLLRAEFGFE